MPSNALTAEFRNFSLTPATGSIDAYIAGVSAIPVLSAEEEHDLAIRLQNDADLDAARTLIMGHLRFVVHIAKGYLGYGLPLADLIQEGNIGLMKAVKRFDPEFGVRLVSFAVHWIRAEIHEFVIRNWRIVKVATTKAQRKLFFKLRGAKKRLGWLNQKEVETVANDLGVEPKTVREMESRLSGHDVTFDRPSDTDEDETSYSPSQYLVAPNADPAGLWEHEDWTSQNVSKLSEAMEQLDERARDILAQRWLTDSKKATLHELADQYGVSAERIRQLENNAIKKLQTAFQA